MQHFSFAAMGSSCELQLQLESRIVARALKRQIQAEVERLENKYSRFRADSLLSAINRSAGSAAGIAVDAETVSLLDHAQRCYEESEGLFDITCGALSRLWDFRQAAVPKADTLAAALKNVGFERLRREQSRLFLPAGMEIDFGGMVKEYAADSAARLAREQGCKRGLVNLGGDIAVIGTGGDQSPWYVGISDPARPSAMIGEIPLHAGGLASSGDYRRYFEYQGQRYSHIINPRTGWPNQGLRAVSVAAPLCTLAGSVATIAMLKPVEAAHYWLAQTGLPYLTVDVEGNLNGSATLRDAQDSQA